MSFRPGKLFWLRDTRNGELVQFTVSVEPDSQITASLEQLPAEICNQFADGRYELLLQRDHREDVQPTLWEADNDRIS